MKKHLFFRALAALIFVILLVISSAISEEVENPHADSWEKQLEEARLKYNEQTVNIYVKGHGKDKSGQINVSFCRLARTSLYYILIKESLQIADEAEMHVILDLITQNELYSEECYGTIAFMKAEWIAHNLAYSMAAGSDSQKKLVETVAKESLESVVEKSRELDLSPIEDMPENEYFVYKTIELLYDLDSH